VKRVIGGRDTRLKKNQEKAELANKAKEKKTTSGDVIREVPQMPSHMFFQHNTALVYVELVIAWARWMLTKGTGRHTMSLSIPTCKLAAKTS
jgi:hypothetical protein